MHVTSRNRLIPSQRNPRKALPRVSVRVQEDVADDDGIQEEVAEEDFVQEEDSVQEEAIVHVSKKKGKKGRKAAVTAVDAIKAAIDAVEAADEDTDGEAGESDGEAGARATENRSAKSKKRAFFHKVRGVVHKLNRSCRELSFLFVSDPEDAQAAQAGAGHGDILVRERTPDDEGRLRGIGMQLCRLHWSSGRDTWLLHPLAETQGEAAVVDCGKDALSLLQEVEAFCGFGLRHPFKERADKAQILARAESAGYQQARKESLERAKARGKTDFVRVDRDGHIIGHYTSKHAALKGAQRGQKALSVASAENKLDHWDAVREDAAARREKAKQHKLEERATGRVGKAKLAVEGSDPSEVPMAQAKKWTAARIIELANKHKVSLRSVLNACNKALALPGPDAKPPKVSVKPPKAGLSGLELAQACKKAYAAYKAKHGKEPTEAQKKKIKEGLAAGGKPSAKPVEVTLQPAVAGLKGKALEAACKKAYAAFKKVAGKAPTAKQKAEIKAKLAAGKPKVRGPKPGVKPPKVSVKKPGVEGRHVLTPAQLKKGQAMLKKCQAFRKKHGRWPTEAEKEVLRKKAA